MRAPSGAVLVLPGSPSALVKIARNIPAGARPTMPAGVFLVGDEEEDVGVIKMQSAV